MPRRANPTVTLLVNGLPFAFSPQAVADLPEAPRFIADLLGRGVATHTAKLYALHVGRLRRQGKLAHPDMITNVTARTAANAFRRFIISARVKVMDSLKAVLPVHVHARLSWLRVSSCVGAYPGKTVPPVRGWDNTDVTRAYVDPGTRDMVYLDPLPWESCDTPTLHVPKREVPAHTDPCESCEVVRMTPEQIEAILCAVEATWGHRNMSALAPSAPLFGEAPMGDEIKQDTLHTVHAVGVSTHDAVSAAIVNARGAIARDVDGFLQLLAEGAESVYISREACGARLHEVLSAIGETWRA